MSISYQVMSQFGELCSLHFVISVPDWSHGLIREMSWDDTINQRVILEKLDNYPEVLNHLISTNRNSPGLGSSTSVLFESEVKNTKGWEKNGSGCLTFSIKAVANVRWFCNPSMFHAVKPLAHVGQLLRPWKRSEWAIPKYATLA